MKFKILQVQAKLRIPPIRTTANSVNGRGYTDAYHWPGHSPFEVVLKSFPPCIHL